MKNGKLYMNPGGFAPLFSSEIVALKRENNPGASR